MASDTWAPPGGPCTFDADLSTVPCPQNLLINFSGPGIFKSTGVMTEPNSTYVSVAGVPEDHTSVVVAGQWPDYWVNTLSPNVSFTSQAPNFSKGASVLNSHNKLVSLAGCRNYIPAPIHTITYGISAPNSVPSPATEPIIGDNTVVNPALVTNGCPVPSADSPGPNVQPNFATGPEQVTFPAEGNTCSTITRRIAPERRSYSSPLITSTTSRPGRPASTPFRSTSIRRHLVLTTSPSPRKELPTGSARF